VLDVFNCLKEDTTSLLIRMLYELGQSWNEELKGKQMLNTKEIARRVYQIQEDWANLKNRASPTKQVFHLLASTAYKIG
jgi:hypothetical protein